MRIYDPPSPRSKSRKSTMPKRKADTVSQTLSDSDSKKVKRDEGVSLKKAVLLDDSDSASGSEDESDGGAQLEQSGFKINESFARRFEHNKRREELQRCKYLLALGRVRLAKSRCSGREIREERQATEWPVRGQV